MTRILWFSLVVLLLSISVGCQSTSDRRPLFGCCNPPPPKPVYVSPLPPPGPPCPIVAVPAGGFPIAPPPPGAPIQQSGGFPIAPQQPPPSISKSPQANGDTQWQPTDRPDAPPRVETNRDVAPRIRLYAPETIEKDKTPTDEPPVGKKPSLQSSLPPIAQFAVAKEDRIFTGLRPKLDGLDWLQANGVKTVLQIRLPDKDDSADRQQVEKRNMRYLSFEVSPATLTKEKADEFIKLIRDGAKQAIFVYDEDGALAGSMWYLHFRLGDFLDDDASQLRARELGLQNNRDGLPREMWLAVQKLLSENSR